MTDQFTEAIKRAFYGALLTFGSVFFVTLQLQAASPNRLEEAGIAAAGGFFAYMLSRGIAEGWVDSNRQANGDVIPSDVTSTPSK